MFVGSRSLGLDALEVYQAFVVLESSYRVGQSRYTDPNLKQSQDYISRGVDKMPKHTPIHTHTHAHIQELILDQPTRSYVLPDCNCF